MITVSEPGPDVTGFESDQSGGRAPDETESIATQAFRGLAQGCVRGGASPTTLQSRQVRLTPHPGDNEGQADPMLSRRRDGGCVFCIAMSYPLG